MMQKQSSIIIGLILIVVGILFLLFQAFPGLAPQIDLAVHWPLIIVGIGGFLLLGALFGNPPLAIPASILSGLGLILAYQNWSGNWASWAYTWTLIPGFVGIGIIIMGLLDWENREKLNDGFRLLIISLGLFVVFGGFLGAFGQFWPLLLILGGLFLLFRGHRNAKKNDDSDQPLEKHS
jgi:hypothetical protein